MLNPISFAMEGFFSDFLCSQLAVVVGVRADSRKLDKQRTYRKRKYVHRLSYDFRLPPPYKLVSLARLMI